MSQRSNQPSNGYHIQCTYLNEELRHEGKWLSLSNVKFLDPNGQERSWEAVNRVTRIRGSDTDAVAAIAIYRRLLHYDVLVLVRQYRPAIKGYSIEFPAGLLESGETSDEAALRELQEETGWQGEVTHMSERLATDPGCSSSILRFATVKINGDSLENQIPKQQLSDGEFVDLVMVPISELHERLNRLTKEGHVIDSRVEAFSIGLQMGLKFARDADIDTAAAHQSSLPVDGSSVRTGNFKKQ